MESTLFLLDCGSSLLSMTGNGFSERVVGAEEMLEMGLVGSGEFGESSGKNPSMPADMSSNGSFSIATTGGGASAVIGFEVEALVAGRIGVDDWD